MEQTFTAGALVVAVFLFILAILWFCLPFAIFGTKEKLDVLIREVKNASAKLDETNEELEKIRAEITGPAFFEHDD